MLFALISMISLYIILIIALVVVAQKKNSASGHAREHAGSFRFIPVDTIIPTNQQNACGPTKVTGVFIVVCPLPAAHPKQKEAYFMEMTGAQILVEGMLREGVEKLFGYAGATICPLADVLRDTPQLDYTLVLQ